MIKYENAWDKIKYLFKIKYNDSDDYDDKYL